MALSSCENFQRARSKRRAALMGCERRCESRPCSHLRPNVAPTPRTPFRYQNKTEATRFADMAIGFVPASPPGQGADESAGSRQPALRKPLTRDATMLSVAPCMR